MKPDYSLGDKFVYSGNDLSKGSFGGFASCLGDAMLRADKDNALKLYQAFPDIFENAWTHSTANKYKSTIKESV
tara:strand:+ start:284 stop:505 length:222 start_codon:yes stop_codon:yes gene_type:complete